MICIHICVCIYIYIYIYIYSIKFHVCVIWFVSCVFLFLLGSEAEDPSPSAATVKSLPGCPSRRDTAIIMVFIRGFRFS